MGGEGAQWLGMAPFTGDRHYVQNMGDGTFHHSGSLAIRAAVAAGSQITFRLLYNDAIAMTGGQDAAGRMGVPELTRWLQTEGVKRVIVTTEDRRATTARRCRRSSRSATARSCRRAARARARRRGHGPDPHRPLRDRGAPAAQARQAADAGRSACWINERVCEGCGDCGDKSSCLSVDPGRRPNSGARPRIHQSSCTQDLACLDGDCPASSSSRRRDGRRQPAPPPAPRSRPADCRSRVRRFATMAVRADARGRRHRRRHRLADPADGGAAAGRWSTGLDQTGLAQKGGPVVSDVRLAPAADDGAPRAAGGEVDVLLGLELLGAVAPETLRTLDPARTVAVVNIHETADRGDGLRRRRSPRCRWPTASPACRRRRSPTRRCSSTPGRSPSRCSATTCRPT